MDINNLQKAGELKKELDKLSALNKFFEVAIDDRSKIRISIERGYRTSSHMNSIDSSDIESLGMNEIIKETLIRAKASCNLKIENVKKEIKKL